MLDVEKGLRCLGRSRKLICSLSWMKLIKFLKATEASRSTIRFSAFNENVDRAVLCFTRTVTIVKVVDVTVSRSFSFNGKQKKAESLSRKGGEWTSELFPVLCSTRAVLCWKIFANKQIISAQERILLHINFIFIDRFSFSRLLSSHSHFDLLELYASTVWLWFLYSSFFVMTLEAAFNETKEHSIDCDALAVSVD